MVTDSGFIGRRIKELREDNNLTQSKLASKLNISQQTLSRYESGVSQVSYEQLSRLVEYFKMPIGYFFGLELQEYSEDEMRLIAYYRSLNSSMQCKALSIVKLLSEDREDGADKR